MNVEHRTLTVAQFSSGQSIVSEKSKLFPQLTLFPRVSETSETNLRNQRFSMLFSHIIHPRAVL